MFYVPLYPDIIFFRGLIGKIKARTNAKQHRKLTASVEEFEKESLEGSTHNSEQKIKISVWYCMFITVKYLWLMYF